jgi:hypothetical protein
MAVNRDPSSGGGDLVGAGAAGGGLSVMILGRSLKAGWMMAGAKLGGATGGGGPGGVVLGALVDGGDGVDGSPVDVTRGGSESGPGGDIVEVSDRTSSWWEQRGNTAWHLALPRPSSEARRLSRVDTAGEDPSGARRPATQLNPTLQRVMHQV